MISIFIKHKFIIGILVAFGLFKINIISYQETDAQIFNEIIESSGSQIQEFGVKASFNTNKSGSLAALELFNLLNLEDINTAKITNLENKYTIDFNNLNASGYVMSFQEDNENTIIVDIKQYSTQNNLESLIEKIKSSVSTLGINLSYSVYAKAKTSTVDIFKTNKAIINLLRFRGYDNIDTINIGNGVSTVASRKDTPINSNKRANVDFNYAVTTYSSGTYIILGAPVIPVPY